MKVTIIIPVYNVAAYIFRCLESVSHQTFQDLEVLFVDDCGTDDSMQIIKDYLVSHRFPDYKIISHQKNGGLSAARNTGLRYATGNYVYFLDSDDVITTDCIQVLVDALRGGEYDFVQGCNEVVGMDDGKEYESIMLSEEAVIGNSEILHLYAKGLWHMTAWNKLCKKRFLLDNNLFFDEGLLHEDVPWSFRLACKAKSMYIKSKKTYIYYIRPSSIITGMTRKRNVEVYIQVFNVITCFIKKEGRILGKDEYAIVEGRKSTLMLSLLELNEKKLFFKYYPIIHRSRYINPLRAWVKGVIGIRYLIRDFHYCLPCTLGAFYRIFYYLLMYRLFHRKVEGALL